MRTLKITLIVQFTFLAFFIPITLSKGQSENSGFASNTGIYRDSSIIKSWATGCKVKRGLMNLADPDMGFASVGKEASALGRAGETGLLSLGDGGEAVLTFDRPIENNEGFDFAVFENSFDGSFLELAFVEVSSDGVNFFRFPSISLTDTNQQIGTHDMLDLRKIHNLAGKYPIYYGTPFDLEDLRNIEELNVNNITHIKVIDVVGSMDPKYASYSAQGHKVNDPWPTPFPSSGFDLDAVAVLWPNVNSNFNKSDSPPPLAFPNPARAGQTVNLVLQQSEQETFKIIDLINVYGVSFKDLIQHNSINTSNLEKGIYQLMLSGIETSQVQKIIIQ